MSALPARAPMPDPLCHAITDAVLYASLFEYPLTVEQLRNSLVGVTATDAAILAAYRRDAELRRAVAFAHGYFFPAGADWFIDERRQREARSHRFLARHRRFLRVLCSLPYVRLVALSGSIAHLNLVEGADLDLFIVTRGAHVWTVTVAAILLARAFGLRRTVCANFALADTRLALEQRDLFVANQMIHLKPIVGRTTYEAFVAANPFVQRYYPNFSATHVGPGPMAAMPSGGRITAVVERVMAGPATVLERWCRRAYRWYLTRRACRWQSPRQVQLDDDCLKLHTNSHRQPVLARFERVTAPAEAPAFGTGQSRPAGSS